jgi:glycosyltransferase EpsE
MAVRNGEHSIRAAIDSALCQTHRVAEIIVVDDNSTDNTSNILASYRGSVVKCVTNNRQLGLARSLNRAAAVAQGECYARLDADDTCERDRIERQLRELRSRGCDVVGGYAYAADEKGRIIGLMKRPIEHDEIVKDILIRNPFIHSTVMMTRDYFASLKGYDERFVRCQDYDMWLRGSRAFRYGNCATVLCTYRMSRSTYDLTKARYAALAIMKTAKRERMSAWRALWVSARPLLALVYALRREY